MLNLLLLPLLLCEFDRHAWTEADDPHRPATVHDIRTTVSISQELTLDRNMPAGRVRGSHVYLYWSEKTIESPHLTCLDLPTGNIVWQQPASADWAMLLFTPQHVIAVRKQDDAGLSLHWYDLATGTPGQGLDCPEHRWLHFLAQRWLVFPNGEIRNAETGGRVATAEFQQIEGLLTHSDTVVSLEVESSALDYDRVLHKIDLNTGKTLARYPVNDSVPQEAIRLIAMDDRRVFFEARSFENQERAAMCFDLQAGKLIWKTPVPQWAPIRIVADHDQGLTRRPTGGNLASNASVDLDAADGKIRFAQDRPSPLSRFDWYLPPRTAALAIRWVDTDLVGWFSTGDRSTLLRVDPHTGQRSWQVAVPYPHPSIRWLPELGDAPRFAVFLGSDDDVQIVNLASGESTVAPRTKLGFPPALATPSSIVPVTDELLNPTPRADFATERLVILGLSALVIAGLLIARFRQSSSQNRQHPF